MQDRDSPMTTPMLGIIRFGNGIGHDNQRLAFIENNQTIHYSDGSKYDSHNVMAQTFFQEITKTSLTSALVRLVIERDATALAANYPECRYCRLCSHSRCMSFMYRVHADFYSMNSWIAVQKRISYAYLHLNYRLCRARIRNWNWR